MYADPSKVRSHRVPLNFDDAEMALINAVVGYNGGERAAVLRNLVMEQVRLVFSGSDFPGVGLGHEEPIKERIHA